MFTEDDLLPISALQHLLFCPRQCALIHVEGLWAENRLTVEGRHLHDRAHQGPTETRGPLRVVRAVGLRSLRLGLTGKADVIEFHRLDDRHVGRDGLRLPGQRGLWRALPVEYKRGKPKRDESDRVQLCAQAMCLEEMLAAPVSEGALFYGRTRKRLDVTFSEPLRKLTQQTAAQLHELVQAGRTPKSQRQAKCKRCSLLHLCLPGALRPRLSAQRYLQRSLHMGLAHAPVEDPDR